MTELDGLAAALKRELPTVTEPLLSRQRARLLADPRARVPTPAARALPALLAFGCALLILALWTSQRPDAPPGDVAQPLSAEAAPLVHAFEDDSSIRLDPGARGTITRQDPTAIRFQLERGLARFDVTPQRGRQFSVVAGSHEITVIGTRFSVDFAPGQRLLVSVDRGRVAVRDASGTQVSLGPGERFEAGRPSAPGKLVVPPATAQTAPAESSSPAPAPARREPAALGWRDLHRRGDYRAALAAARRAGYERLLSELSAAELAELADAARFAGASREALAALAALERRFPTTEPARQAAFLSGRVLLQAGNVTGAIAAFERYLARDAAGVYSAEAMGRLLELYTRRNDTTRARDMARRYLARAPQGAYAKLARSVLSAP